jgi:hypothetical protein
MPIQTRRSRPKASMSPMTGVLRNVGESLLSLTLRACKRLDGGMIYVNSEFQVLGDCAVWLVASCRSIVNSNIRPHTVRRRYGSS